MLQTRAMAMSLKSRCVVTGVETFPVGISWRSRKKLTRQLIAKLGLPPRSWTIFCLFSCQTIASPSSNSCMCRRVCVGRVSCYPDEGRARE